MSVVCGSVDRTFSINNLSTHWPVVFQVSGYVPSGQQMTPIDYGISRLKVKITVSMNPKSLPDYEVNS